MPERRHRTEHAREAVGAQRCLVESVSRHDARSIALHDDVGVERHVSECRELIGIGEVAVGLTLAVSGVDHEGGDDRNVGTPHVQHIGTEGRQRPATGRSGEHTSEVDDAEAVERTDR